MKCIRLNRKSWCPFYRYVGREGINLCTEEQRRELEYREYCVFDEIDEIDSFASFDNSEADEDFENGLLGRQG